MRRYMYIVARTYTWLMPIPTVEPFVHEQQPLVALDGRWVTCTEPSLVLLELPAASP